MFIPLLHGVRGSVATAHTLIEGTGAVWSVAGCPFENARSCQCTFSYPVHATFARSQCNQHHRPCNKHTMLAFHAPPPQTLQVQELEAEAAALMAAAKGSPSPQPSGSAPSKALRKEREKLSRLNTRARDQRCALVAAATAGSQLPTLLLLNLARKDSEKPQLLPAMVIGVVDSEDDTPMALYQKQTGGNNGVSGGEEGEGESEDAASSGGLPASLKGLQKPLLFCLGADNRLMVVSASHVVGTCSDDALVTELTQQYAATWAALAPGWRAAVEDVRAWKNHAGGDQGRGHGASEIVSALACCCAVWPCVHMHACAHSRCVTLCMRMHLCVCGSAFAYTCC